MKISTDYEDTVEKKITDNNVYANEKIFNVDSYL